MRKYLLPKEGNFYKANLHMHTTISDGKMTVEETKEEFLKRGYSIVAFTDHEIMVPHNDLTDDKFLAITSTEIAVNKQTDKNFSFRKTYHLNIYSPEPEQTVFDSFTINSVWLKHSRDYISDEQKQVCFNREYSIDCINQIIEEANKKGCLVSYNHPVWSLQNYSDYIDLKGVWGVEWYNHCSSRIGHVDNILPVDDLLKKGERVFPIATDDAHSLEDCFGGFVMVKAGKLEYKTIFEALKRGNFYSSNKPEIYELYIENNVMTIKTSPVKKIYFTTDRRTSKCFESNELTEASFDLKEYLSYVKDGDYDKQYVRVTIIDEFGKCAHTRAYFVNELIDEFGD